MSGMALEVRHLMKRFGGLQVANDVSMSLEIGARHALIGPNGAGKSTLVGLISGTIRPNAGSVRLFGEEVTDAGPARRTKLGLVRTFQITSLFAKLSVLENLYLAVSEQRGESLTMWRPAAKRGETLARAEALLAQFRLTEFANRSVSELAYGQQRLVEIALALALQPKVLLLDEPAAGIPGGETRLLMDAIEALPADISVLMIEHDMSLVRRFARDATLLVHGAVAATGAINELMESETVREVYLGKAAAARTVRHA
jgi:ABC-type branched-subunit amino acid transport system ATPase component